MNPVTQAYFRAINEKMKEIALDMAGGRSVDADNIDRTAQLTSKMAGMYESLRDILDIEISKE